MRCADKDQTIKIHHLTKPFLLAIFLFILTTLFPSVHADALDSDCTVRLNSCNADEIRVLSLEKPTNSMAGLNDSYTYKVCCKGPFLRHDYMCEYNYTDIFVELNYSRNSHGQYKVPGTYIIPQCLASYTTFACFLQQNCDPGFHCVVGISMGPQAGTNSHFADCSQTPANYWKICCGTNTECGNGIVEPGEECDPGSPTPPPFSAWDNFRWITDCTYLDTFSDPMPGGQKALACGPRTCFFNTTNCTQTPPPTTNAICGDGIIDINETCDGDNWGPYVDDCTWFDSFAGGNLSCFPPGGYGSDPGDPIQCHFNTTGCLPGFFQIPMICGRVNHTNPLDTAPPTDPRISKIITVACNDTLYNRQTEPTFMCPGETDCIYRNETDVNDDHYHCRPDGGEYRNRFSDPIVCHGKKQDGSALNTWCPKYFRFDETRGYCVFDEPVQDSGNMSAWYYNDYQANCSLTLSQMTTNYTLGKQCLEPDDLDGPPDDMYPKTDVVCKNFTITNYNNTYNPFRPYGFYHLREAIVY